MGLNPNINNDYTIVSDREIASILNYFTPEMVRNVLDDVLQDKMRSYTTNIGNMVNAYETNFRIALSDYPEFSNDLVKIRDEAFKSIMNQVCGFHNIDWELEVGMDLYTVAFYTYQFLVSDFKRNITRFFSNFILREKDNIYASLNLGEIKKGKDSSSAYSKKVYNGIDNKIITIHANLDYVLTQISGFDIDLNTIIDNTYAGDKNVIALLQNVLADKGNFYKMFYVGTLNSSDRAELITAIRLQLQQLPVGIEDYIEKEGE